MFFSPRGGKRLKDRNRQRSVRLPFRPILEALEDRITPSTTVTVTNTTDTGADSLRSAIAAADASSAGVGGPVYQINLNAGTYNLNAALGSLKLTNTAGTTIILDGAGTGTGGTTLTVTGGASQILKIAPGTNVIVENLSIKGGRATTGVALGLTATGGGLVNDGGNVTLSNVSFTSNVADATATVAGTAAGGAIFSVGGTLTLDAVTLTNNQAIGGTGSAATGQTGGFAEGGGLAAINTVVVTNIPTAPNMPANPGTALGASFNPSSVGRPLLTVTNNTARGGNGGKGGSNLATASGTGGAAAFGGGLYLQGGTANLTAVSLIGNTVQGGAGSSGADNAGGGGAGGRGGNGSGGGLYLTGSASVLVRASTIAGNGALGGGSGNGGNALANGQAGGLSNIAGTAAGGGLASFDAGDALTMINDTVAENFAVGGNGGNGGKAQTGGTAGVGGGGGDAQGGGLAFLASTSSDTLTNVTVANNTLQVGFGGTGGQAPTPAANGMPGVAEGGGISSAAGSDAVAVLLVNTVIAGNGSVGLATTIGADEEGFLNNGSANNLITDATGSAFLLPGLYDSTTNTAFNHNLINVNPLLGTLAFNGGPTLTLALNAGSPAIGAGASTLVNGGLDQRGVTRASAVDLGAFQSGGTIPPVTAVTINVTPATQTILQGATAVTFQVEVASANGGTGLSGGIVTVNATDANKNLVSSTSVNLQPNGLETVTLTLPPTQAVGTYSIAATYTDANGHAFNTTGTATLTINAPPVTGTDNGSGNNSGEPSRPTPGPLQAIEAVFFDGITLALDLISGRSTAAVIADLEFNLPFAPFGEFWERLGIQVVLDSQQQ